MPNYLKAAQALGAKGAEVRDVAEMIESFDQSTGPVAKKLQIEALEKLIKLRKFMNPYTRQAMLDILKKEGIA
jgi:hypothetical protein